MFRTNKLMDKVSVLQLPMNYVGVSIRKVQRINTLYFIHGIVSLCFIGYVFFNIFFKEAMFSNTYMNIILMEGLLFFIVTYLFPKLEYLDKINRHLISTKFIDDVLNKSPMYYLSLLYLLLSIFAMAAYIIADNFNN
jgi:hypothetical protein